MLIGAYIPMSCPIRDSLLGLHSSGAAPPLELRTAEIYGKKAARKANGQLNDKVVALHPSSVLHGCQARIGHLVLAGAKNDRLPSPLVVFNGRMKTSRDFVRQLRHHVSRTSQPHTATHHAM